LIFIQEDNIDGFVRGSSILFFSSVQTVYAEDQASFLPFPPKTSDRESESDYSLPPRIEIEKEWIYIYTSPHMRHVLRRDKY
jgi:hypothetical protein